MQSTKTNLSEPTRIWIVDDEPISRFVLRKCIPSPERFQVVAEYENGLDALHDLETCVKKQYQKVPDVIILDINMPFMDAWEFMDRYENLFKEGDGPKVFILSSSANDQDLNRSRSFEAIEEYLIKPTSLLEMQDILKKHFSPGSRQKTA